MRTYWIETLLIAALFTTAMGYTLAQAEGDNNTNVNSSSATPDYVYGDKSGVVPDYVYGNNGGNNNTNIAITPRGTTISIQPLDAPNNPYIKQYNDFDRWMYKNLDTDYTRTTITSNEKGTVINRNLFNNPVGGNRRVPVLVDENGFMIPTTSPRYLTPQFVQTAPGEYTAADDDLYDNVLGDTTTADPGAKVTPGTASNDKVKVAVKGETRIRPQIAYTYTTAMSEDEYAKFRAAQIEAAATILPPVPNWVDTLHPTTFTLLPNGAILVPSGDSGSKSTVTVYSPTGDSLGVVNNAEEWHKFFAKNYDDIVAKASAQGWDVVEHNGYLVLRSRDDRKVKAVFDWDGKPIELTSELAPRPYYFTPLRWENIAPVAVQQRKVPMAGREPDAQSTAGTEHQSDNSPAPDKK
jgi:hypothetical protein